MSDGGDDAGDAENVEDVENFEDVEGGEGAIDSGDLEDVASCCSGPIGSCFCCLVGMILLLAVPYGIWHNEGDYVKRQMALAHAMSITKSPCGYDASGSCQGCDLSSIKAGDLVFLACKLDNMKSLEEWAPKFPAAELRDAVKGQRAAKFHWNMSMYQYVHNPDTQKTILMDTYQGGRANTYACPAASGLNIDNDPGARQRQHHCCLMPSMLPSGSPPSPGYSAFVANYMGDHKDCQYRYVAGAHQAQPRGGVDARRLGADGEREAAGAEGPQDGSSEGEEAKEAEAGDEEAEEEEAEEEAEGEAEEQQEPEAPARRLGSRRRSDTRRRRTHFTCKFRCRSWAKGFRGWQASSPTTWTDQPATLFGNPGKVGYLSGSPATNVPSLRNGSDMHNVVAGSGGVNAGGFTLETFEPDWDSDKLWETYKDAEMKPFTAGTKALGKNAVGAPKTVGPLSITTYTRSEKWTTENSKLQENCIYSVGGQGAPEAGDLRVCFYAATLTQLSILAEVRVSSAGKSLSVSREHLHAEQALGVQLMNGYLLAKDEIVPLKTLEKRLSAQSGAMLKILRITLPILLIIAWYCFFKPIPAMIGQMGDMWSMVPCVGAIIEDILDFIETLVDCLLCCVSCGLGLSCALFVMAIAWLRFRPLIGGGMLLLCVAFGACVIAMRQRQKGQPKLAKFKKKKEGELLQQQDAPQQQQE